MTAKVDFKDTEFLNAFNGPHWCVEKFSTRSLSKIWPKLRIFLGWSKNFLALLCGFAWGLGDLFRHQLHNTKFYCIWSCAILADSIPFWWFNFRRWKSISKSYTNNDGKSLGFNQVVHFVLKTLSNEKFYMEHSKILCNVQLIFIIIFLKSKEKARYKIHAFPQCFY